MAKPQVEDFTSKTALVTGGGSGIGAAVVQTLFAGGANIVIADCNGASANAVADSLDADGKRVIAIAIDVSLSADVQKAVKLCVDRFGRLDLAVNSAGIGQRPVPAADFDEAEWCRVIAVDLTAVFLCLKHQTRAMLADGRGGAIVNIASALGVIGAPCGAAYVAAKHGVIGLTKSVALDYAARGIRVNAVAPGLIRTPLTADAFNSGAEQTMLANHPIGRFGEPQEVADLASFLLSDRASFITGSTHLVDGAWTAH